MCYSTQNRKNQCMSSLRLIILTNFLWRHDQIERNNFVAILPVLYIIEAKSYTSSCLNQRFAKCFLRNYLIYADLIFSRKPIIYTRKMLGTLSRTNLWVNSCFNVRSIVNILYPWNKLNRIGHLAVQSNNLNCLSNSSARNSAKTSFSLC